MFDELKEIDYDPEFKEINRQEQRLGDKLIREARQRSSEELALFRKRRPLTEAEAEQAQHTLRKTQNRIEALNKRITERKEFIEDRCQELSLTFSRTERPNLYKAIKKLFNVKTETITFEMYKTALKIREEEMLKESEEAFNES